MNDSTIEWAHVIGQALFVQMLDTVHYNQIAGREIKAFFKDSEIDYADVKGNVQAVFYPLDADSAMIGMNTTEGSSLRTYFKMRAVNKIVMLGHSNGVMYPMEKLDRKKMYLSNFNLFEEIHLGTGWPIDWSFSREILMEIEGLQQGQLVETDIRIIVEE